MSYGYYKLKAILIGILIFLVFGEVGYRTYVYIFKPLHRPSKISGFLWEPTPNADVVEDGIRYKINSNGFRDYEYPIQKPKDTFRIAIIGDSTTWGDTELPDTYPKILEKELRVLYSGKKIEVLNFGIRGISSNHHLNLLKERVLRYAPDLVILGYCLNDIKFPSIYDKPAAMWFLQNSNFADFIAIRAGTAIQAWQYGTKGWDAYYFEQLKLYEDRQRISMLKANLREMKTILGNRSIRFAVVIFPFKQQFVENASLKPQEELATIGQEEGLSILDPLSELKRYKPDELYLKNEFVHFSTQGNKVVAMSILKFLQTKELVNASR